MHVRDRRIALLLLRENDGRRSGVQHTMSREIALLLPSSLLVRLEVSSWCSGRATWPDLQPGRDEWRDFYLLLSLLHMRVDVKFLPIAWIGTRQPASAKSADRMTL